MLQQVFCGTRRDAGRVDTRRHVPPGPKLLPKLPLRLALRSRLLYIINRDFKNKISSVRGSDPAESELDPSEPEPMVQFEVQQIPWTEPEVRFKVQQNTQRTGPNRTWASLHRSHTCMKPLAMEFCRACACRYLHSQITNKMWSLRTRGAPYPVTFTIYTYRCRNSLNLSQVVIRHV